jgi:hypothetical protein
MQSQTAKTAGTDPTNLSDLIETEREFVAIAIVPSRAFLIIYMYPP